MKFVDEATIRVEAGDGVERLHELSPREVRPAGRP